MLVDAVGDGDPAAVPDADGSVPTRVGDGLGVREPVAVRVVDVLGVGVMGHCGNTVGLGCTTGAQYAAPAGVPATRLAAQAAQATSVWVAPDPSSGGAYLPAGHGEQPKRLPPPDRVAE